MWYLYYFILHLLVYTLIRLEFLIWNWSSLKNLTFNEYLLAFLNGTRFDLSAMALTVGLAFLGVIWFSHKIKWTRLWLYFFVFINICFYTANTMDVELYNFTAKRLSWSALFLAQEAQFSNLIKPYLALATTSFIIILAYVLLAIFLIKKFKLSTTIKNKTIMTFVVIILSVLASRGGFQHKPLTYVDAKIFNNSYANNLILNSTFTFLKSINRKSIERQEYYLPNEMLALLNQQSELDFKVVDSTKINIVLIILESFSEEYSELRNPEAMPYFNSLRTKSADFKKSFANGRRSIEGVAALLSGIPALMEEPFISSEYSANEIIGLGSLLTRNNYNTSFFHGANVGSMHFDSFVKSIGINKHFSREDYPNKENDDGVWGIYDEPFLKWACGKLTDIGSPFFSTIFTLSSHQPYKLPAEYQGKFKDDRHEILKSVRYADHALEQFFKCAQEKPWVKDTLFILTGDHTGPELKPNTEFKDRYRVPILFYGPGFDWLKKMNINQYAQQIDILPTLLDILSIKQKNVNYLSRSLLRSGPKIIPLFSDGHYELVGDVKNQDQQIKAVQQYFSQGLYDNRLYYPLKTE